MRLSVRFAAAILVLAVPTVAKAQIIGFDDVSNTATIGTGIENGYYGFNWNNWNVTNTNWEDLLPGGHYQKARSGEYVAYNTGGNMASISRDTYFNFQSAWFSSGWLDPILLTVTGYRNGEAVFTSALELTTGAAVYHEFDWFDIDMVTFETAGGEPLVNPQYAWRHFNMEDAVFSASAATGFTTTPEPATVGLMATGLVGLAGAGWVRRRKSNGAAQQQSE